MTKNKAFEVYRIYRGLKFHFTTKNYDFKTFHAITVNDVDQWNKSNFCEIFAFYSNKLSIVKLKDFFIANFLNDVKYFPTNFENEYNIYLKWLGKINSIKYNFEKDAMKIKNFLIQNNMQINDILRSKNGKLPIILYMVFKNIINYESFIILDNIFCILVNLDFISSDNKILYGNRILLLKKYKSFFIIKNIEDYKIILKKVFKN